MRKFILTSAIAGTSFICGTQFDSSYITGLFARDGHAATALVSSPPSLAVPSSTTELKQQEAWKLPSRSSEIMKFGYPGYDNLRTYDDFVLSYDRKTRTAHWVQEHLTPDRLEYDPSVDRSKCTFKPDETIHPFFRSLNEDYFRSGYDRGHLAPAGNHRRTQAAIDQTFFLTNMSPQVGKGFNRDKWNDVEKHVRRQARKNPNVYIVTGPLYLPKQEADGNLYVKYKVIGKNHVAVPTHFFKVALIETSPEKYELECYLLPNEAIPNEKPISDFFVPLDAIERAAGILIFERLPKNKIIKTNGKKSGWF
ncbi:unnamed protein product [Bursaphelenchus xylophilus]|uniref:Endonuclease n=1 Tax=Bursaphelenchus xylophilus TaxID=6326 RepID=A0A7I8X189_BURXY|nr:extracellular nuclease 6 [Bursaphelenchus xylophilus]CAD5234369.1 unnamed protein product [Bursaphelenchus xylophilus]CAG9130093.1 unnamed protein product [Bursaphelenchus xylophilus]